MRAAGDSHCARRGLQRTRARTRAEKNTRGAKTPRQGLYQRNGLRHAEPSLVGRILARVSPTLV
eukprot:366278-Chlamydomonas_euryale.AAC.38